MKLTLLLFLAAGMTARGAAPAPAFLPRSLAERIVLLAPDGSSREDRAIGRWQQRLRASPDAESFERLAWAYIARARRTLDAGDYQLAQKTAEAMEVRYGISPSSLLLRGHVLDNLHRFREAEVIAHQLVGRRGDASDYALLSDTLMEQGRLSEAVAACQEEMNRRPGVEAYARAAHLRWLTGDLPGATTLMEAAVRATSPVDASTCAWTLCRLSGYALQSGDAGRALRLAETAARVAPNYPPALLAQGRAALAQGRPVPAVAALEQAARLNPLPEYQWWLADAFRAAGRPAEAARVEQVLAAGAEVSDPRTYALYLATRARELAPASPSQAALAVHLARDELANRGDPLSQDALAWAQAAAGDPDAAAQTMAKALASGTRDARLFLHAALIARARGDEVAARRYQAAATSGAATLTPSERQLLSLSVQPQST